MENAIHSKNANNIKAKIICELANGATTPEADVILYNKGVHLIPYILASAGGVIVSYFEMLQDKLLYFWDEPEVHQRPDKKNDACPWMCYRSDKRKENSSTISRNVSRRCKGSRSLQTAWLGLISVI